jgi:hypothetical protein
MKQNLKLDEPTLLQMAADRVKMFRPTPG